MKILVIRLGAIGDMIMITPLLKALYEDGNIIDVYCKRSASDIIRHNPHVKKVLYHDDSLKIEDCDIAFEKAGEGYERVINLTGSIEGSLVKVQGTHEDKWPQYFKHAHCNINYYDQTMMLGGYPEKKGENGELFFSAAEESAARQYRRKYKDKFLILWALAGSSIHKAYPMAEVVAKKFLNRHPDAMTITVGDALSSILEWRHPQAKSYSGIWPVRKSMIMAKYADLVIGPDTGMLHAAGCYDTPKIILLTAVTHENVSKYWNNCYHILPRNTECYPCHRLIYTRDACPTMPGINAAACSVNINANEVYSTIEDVYEKWKEAKNGNVLQRGIFSLCGRRNGVLLGQSA